MIKVEIRDLHSTKQVKPRFCDGVIDDNGNIFLVQKHRSGKQVHQTIPWNDVVQQIEEAIRNNENNRLT